MSIDQNIISIIILNDNITVHLFYINRPTATVSLVLFTMRDKKYTETQIEKCNQMLNFGEGRYFGLNLDGVWRLGHRISLLLK